MGCLEESFVNRIVLEGANMYQAVKWPEQTEN